jgi:hypothetical protein
MMRQSVKRRPRARPLLIAAAGVLIFSAFGVAIGQTGRQKIPPDTATQLNLAERQLERKKQEIRDFKAEQKRLIDELLKCVEAAKNLYDVSTCERVDKEETLKIRQAMKGSEPAKR